MGIETRNKCGGKCRVGWGLRQGINVEVRVG